MEIQLYYAWEPLINSFWTKPADLVLLITMSFESFEPQAFVITNVNTHKNIQIPKKTANIIIVIKSIGRLSLNNLIAIPSICLSGLTINIPKQWSVNWKVLDHFIIFFHLFL